MKRKLPFTDFFSRCKRQKIDDYKNDKNDIMQFNKEWIHEQNDKTNWEIRFSLKYQYLKYYLKGYLEDYKDNEKYIKYGNAYTKYNKSDLVRYIKIKDHSDIIQYEGKLKQLIWNGESGFYYHIFQYTKTYKDKNNTKSIIYYHKLGQKNDKTIYQYECKECDNNDYNVTLTKDAQYMIISKNYINKYKNKTKIVNLKTNQQHYVCGSLAYITNNDDLFYFITHKDSPNNKVITLNIQKTDERFWTTLIPETNNMLDSVCVFNKKYLVLKYIQDVSHILRIHSLKTGKFINQIDIPKYCSVHLEYSDNSNEFNYVYESYLIPETRYNYSFKTKKSKLIDTDNIKWFRPENYKLEQVFYESKDGTKVPMYIISRADQKKNGEDVVLLEGYGGFGLSIMPKFHWSYIAFLDLIGTSIAFPNIRGGNEYGNQWYNHGKMEFKQNTFDDFQMAGKYLIEQKYVHPNKLVAYGSSNGGLLIGACVNQAPELFKVAIIGNAVLDMLQFHKYYQGQWWLYEYGNPNNKRHVTYLEKYSPLHNIDSNINYPSIFILTSEKDNIVTPIHSYQYFDKMTQHNDNCLIKIDHSKLHVQTHEDILDIYTFIALNIN